MRVPKIPQPGIFSLKEPSDKKQQQQQQEN